MNDFNSGGFRELITDWCYWQVVGNRRQGAEPPKTLIKKQYKALDNVGYTYSPSIQASEIGSLL